MSGDWAVGGDEFGKFWAVSISVSVSMIGLLVVIIRWRAIGGWMERTAERVRVKFGIDT
jgi:hypothetical protein